jgi:futalosine hydrolase
MRLLVVTAVGREADACRSVPGAKVVTSGVGRTNAAIATTRAILEDGPFDALVSAGVAGSLPGSDLSIGDIVIASSSIYFEEGLLAPDGFHDLTSMGFPLGDFEGNAVPGDPGLLEQVGPLGRHGPIATVGTCSGTDSAAEAVVGRTGAIAEAMEGAAVLHAGSAFGVPGLEVRAISNSTGDRDRQQWDLALGVRALENVFSRLGQILGSA